MLHSTHSHVCLQDENKLQQFNEEKLQKWDHPNLCKHQIGCYLLLNVSSIVTWVIENQKSRYLCLWFNRWCQSVSLHVTKIIFSVSLLLFLFHIYLIIHLILSDILWIDTTLGLWIGSRKALYKENILHKFINQSYWWVYKKTAGDCLKH